MARRLARICLARPPQNDKTGRGIARKQGWERDMALAPSVATSVDPSAAERPGKGGGGTKVVLILAFAVFFLQGGVTNINDTARKSVGEGKRVAGREDPGGRRCRK